MDEMDPTDLEREDSGFSYKAMLTRDRRRWSVADRDGDDALTKTEFTDFLHPEESPYMRDVVVAETVEDIDKDDDGKVSVEEYIGDMYRATDDGDDEPDWVKHERETFKTFRDKDGDGSLNNEEVKDWIIPQDFDHAEAESKHLIYEADSDSDEKLTKEEILNKYDVFVGSQATDFGEWNFFENSLKILKVFFEIFSKFSSNFTQTFSPFQVKLWSATMNFKPKKPPLKASTK